MPAAPGQTFRFGGWRHRRGELSLGRCQVMAIANITPDSFSDGGRWLVEADSPPAVSVVVKQCRAWVEAGATILDVGGESTRPGASAVSAQLERARVVPVIEALANDEKCRQAVVSVDTRHASVARAALEAGADAVNDISGLADSKMGAVVAEFGAGLVVGHMRGTPSTMQQDIRFASLVDEVVAELRASMQRARDAGVRDEHMLVDPCIGFGKTAEQSAALSLSAEVLEQGCGRPVLIGVSRKSFIGKLTGLPVEERAAASVQAGILAAHHGASVLRVHDVIETLTGLELLRGMLESARAEGVVASRASGEHGEEPAA